MLSLDQMVDKAYELVTKKYQNNGHLDRLTHILGVADMAEELAKRYHTDPRKAKIAAYMHDYYKYESIEEMAEVIKDKDLLAECSILPTLYHAYASAVAYRNLFLPVDEEIYLAIKNHVFGRVDMGKLEEILVISDYIEVNRVYDNCIQCRNVCRESGLNAAMVFSTSHVISYVLKNKGTPHPLQYEVLKQYKEKLQMELLHKIKDNIERVKGYDTICFDMKGVSPLFDYMIIVTIDSPRQAEALTQYIKEDYAKAGISLNAIEGKGSSWVLMDCRDIIVHVFTKDEREHYSLEKLYMDMPKIEL